MYTNNSVVKHGQLHSHNVYAINLVSNTNSLHGHLHRHVVYAV